MVMREGLKRAKAKGDLTGPGLRTAMETIADFDTGGLTPLLTYTPEDHRPTTTCGMYEIKDGKMSLVGDMTIERKPEYMGPFKK